MVLTSGILCKVLFLSAESNPSCQVEICLRTAMFKFQNVNMWLMLHELSFQILSAEPNAVTLLTRYGYCQRGTLLKIQNIHTNLTSRTWGIAHRPQQQTYMNKSWLHCKYQQVPSHEWFNQSGILSWWLEICIRSWCYESFGSDWSKLTPDHCKHSSSVGTLTLACGITCHISVATL